MNYTLLVVKLKTSENISPWFDKSKYIHRKTIISSLNN